jgi:hypothetical protein
LVLQIKGKKRMKKMKNQNVLKTSTIALILLLAVSVTLTAIPFVVGQAVESKTTYATCGLMPNPIGVNQDVLVWLGITDYLVTQSDGWEGLTVTVTKPDGGTDTLGPFRTDSTGSTGTLYTPNQVGSYTFQTHFPAQTYTWNEAPIFDPGLLGRTILYEASNSDLVELVVQAEPIAYYPQHSLPTEYWTRPIDAQLREWTTIAGNWVTTPPNMYAPYNEFAPDTAHILWAKALATGGLVGGELGNHAYDGGDAYEGKFLTQNDASSIIIGGKLFFNRHQARGDSTLEKEVVAVDLRTGEELWARTLGNNETLAFGQVFYWDSFNMHSSFEYIWTTDGTVDIYVFGNKVAEGVRPTIGTTWKAFDPFTGRWVYTMENVPSGSILQGPKGEIFIYTVDLAAGTMSLWNSSRVVSDRGSWRPHGQTFDATNGVEWTVNLPASLPPMPERSGAIVLADRVIGSTASLFVQKTEDTPVTSWGVSLKPGHEGELLFNTVWQPPAGDLSLGIDAASLEDGVFTLWSKEERAHYGFSLDTGTLMWGPTPSQTQTDIFGIQNVFAYGNLYSVGMGGIVYCYDAQTGAFKWDYPAVDPFNEILWSNNWPLHIDIITDGKLYLSHSEHSPIDPKPRGAPYICLDATTGQEVFKINGAFRGTDWGGNQIIGDSIIASYNTYDQRIYAIGKGPSATSVMASPKVTNKGSSVLIEGMVTDVSSGTKSDEIVARFPDGVPAVSDASISEWMKYVYMQFERPTDTTGVTVMLDAIAPNGEFINIGTTVSDSNGFYSYKWVPETEGKYTIIASFMGSGAYWASYAQSAVIIDPAVSPSGPITPEDSAPLITTEVAIVLVAAIAAIVIIVFLAIRRRK